MFVPNAVPVLTEWRCISRFGLASCSFLRHVQQELLVIRFHFRKKFAQFGKVNGVLACASLFIVLRRFQLAQ
jgi:hypothetical protein